MTFPANPAERQPKGDHNRRLSLGLDPESFAAAAGITVEELKDYENTWPDHEFSPMVAERVGEALERLENQLPNSEAAGIRQVREGDAVDGPVLLAPEQSFEQQVRDTAYFMWEADGRPSGRDEEYWHRAREACMGQFRLDEQFEDAVSEEDQDPRLT
ncbi:DUF2934 domain-containing protein [Devosia sp. A16]|uniref:DUF2934 domain-containing protein n=1 Tax=Devosia sp. A16 TaxID=1736675 RepID=UPI0018D13FC9|nr:DUF2934 domain-containing protein [Devosia sp. A16]